MSYKHTFPQYEEFVNITHPSQIKDQKTREKVKSFASRRRNVKRGGVRPPRDTGACSNKTVSKTGVVSHSRDEQGLHKPVAGEVKHDSDQRLNQEDIVEKDASPDQASVTLVMPYVQSYPDTSRTRIHGLIEYYYNVFGPEDVWKPVLTSQESSIIVRRLHIQTAVADPLMAESIFAICQSRREKRIDPLRTASALVLSHRAKIMSLLQERLATPDTATNDTTFIAVAALISLALTYQDWVSFQFNLKGFRRMTALRGGVDSLGYEGLIRTYVGWAEMNWAAYMAEQVAQSKEKQLPEYPTHPFTQDVLRLLTKLPVGLQQEALSLGLSLKVLTFLKAISGLIATREEAQAVKRGELYLRRLGLTTRANLLLSTLVLKPAERVLIMAALAYVTSLDGRIHPAKYPKLLEDHVVELPVLLPEIEASDSALWAAIVIPSSIEGEMVPVGIKWHALDCLMGGDGLVKDWKEVREILKKFYWNASMEQRWEEFWNTAMERKRRMNLGPGD